MEGMGSPRCGVREASPLLGWCSSRGGDDDGDEGDEDDDGDAHGARVRSWRTCGRCPVLRGLDPARSGGAPSGACAGLAAAAPSSGLFVETAQIRVVSSPW